MWVAHLKALRFIEDRNIDGVACDSASVACLRSCPHNMVLLEGNGDRRSWKPRRAGFWGAREQITTGENSRIDIGRFLGVEASIPWKTQSSASLGRKKYLVRFGLWVVH